MAFIHTQGQGWLPGDRIASNPPEVDYSKVMESDRELLKWMTSMEHYGFCFVRRVPVTAGEMLVNKLGAINPQHCVWSVLDLSIRFDKINYSFLFAMLSRHLSYCTCMTKFALASVMLRNRN